MQDIQSNIKVTVNLITPLPKDHSIKKVKSLFKKYNEKTPANNLKFIKKKDNVLYKNVLIDY